MHLSLRDIAQTKYAQRDLGGKEIRHEMLLQTRASGEVELVLVLTCEDGYEAVLAEAHEAGTGSRPVSATAGGLPVERVSKGWGAWPGDARAEVPVRMVVLNAILPADTDTVTLELPSLGGSQTLAIADIGDLPSEKTENGLSLTFGEVGGAIFSRITYYTDGPSWPPPLRVDTMGELGGVRMESFDGRVDAQLASWNHLDGFLAYEVEISDS